VTLFAGPDPRTKFFGGFYFGQVICHFAYAHDQFGPKEQTVSVVVTHAEEDPEEVLRQVENAADKLAELVEAGYRLTAVYTLKGWTLTPGFPREIPNNPAIPLRYLTRTYRTPRLIA